MDQNIKSKIKTEAHKLFEKISYAKTSVSDIASAAGIGKGTVYQHYKNKEEIILSIIKMKFDSIRENELDFFHDPAIQLEKKIVYFNNMIIEEIISTKKLLFGPYENLKGEVIKNVFDKTEHYYEICADFIFDLIMLHQITYHKPVARLKSDIQEYFHLIVGRIFYHFFKIDWIEVEHLKKKLEAVSYKIFETVVLE